MAPDAKDDSADASEPPESAPDLSTWKAALPERASACAGDGRHPLLAFPLMLLGVVATAAAGFVAAGIAVAFLALFVACLQLAPEPMNVVKFVLLLGRVGDVIIFVALALFCFFAICVTNIFVLPIFVRLARNRREGTVFLYGLISAGLAAVSFKAAIVLIFEPGAPSIRTIGILPAVRWAWGVTTADRVLTTIWVALTALIGATLAWAGALDGRWCAACNGRSMRRAREVGLQYRLLRNVVSACETRQPERAANAAAGRPTGQVGLDGRVALYECRGCRRGLLEATATYERSDQRATWLAASLPLSPGDLSVVAPIMARGPAPPRRRKRTRKHLS